ncbi:MAG: PAS domain S-box protein, partial [Planctomycetia bacterium]|nr:PAS domain S-box protein [Planctomycetia bacterium]
AVALVQPVYARGRVPSSVAERRAALRGWAFVILDPTLVIDHARATLDPEGLDICLYDVTDPGNSVFLGHSLSRLDDEDGRTCPRERSQAVAGAHQSTPVAIGGRRWEVITQPAPSFGETRRPWQPWAALATGLVLTALLTQTLRASLGREAAVQRAVRDRTAALSIAVDDLRRENTVRRRAEADFAEQTERLRVTLRSIGDAVLTCDAAGRVDYLNPAAETLTGWTAPAARDHTLHEVLRFVDEKSRAPRPDIVDEMLHAEAATETAIPVVLVAVGGAERSVWPRWAPIADPVGRTHGAVVALRDVTEARRAEQAVREREELFRVLSAELPDALFLLDPNDARSPLRIVHANEAAARMHGFPVERLLGMSILELDDPATAAEGPERVRRLRAGETLTFEARHRRADGSFFPLEVIAREIAWGGRRLVLSLDRDITERRRVEDERRRLETQVQHAQRLESLGVLAGGIAHDFNNLLMGVLGNADLALLHLEPGSPAAARVEDLKRAGLRASDLTQQLLAYAGKGRFVVEPLDLNDVVRDMAKLLQVSISKRVKLVLDFADDLPPVEADAAQLRQVVMNLITNASEAMGEREGVVTLRTAREAVDAAWLATAYGGAGLAPGPYVVLEVADTGVGMDEATQRKIFEPFFTTKFTGRGLGLAALLGIVRGHHGAVRVTSAPGQGSTFRVVLPPYRGDRPVRRAPPARAADAVRGGGTVLVIDDDPTVLEVVSRMLAGAGYDVVFAAEGREGVERFRAEKDRVRAVLLDMTMPGLSSEETLKQIRAVRGDVKVLVISGFTQEDAMARFAGLGVEGFVQKPFERQTLIARVGALLR